MEGLVMRPPVRTGVTYARQRREIDASSAAGALWLI